jgi:hypothetical protein
VTTSMLRRAPLQPLGPSPSGGGLLPFVGGERGEAPASDEGLGRSCGGGGHAGAFGFVEVEVTLPGEEMSSVRGGGSPTDQVPHGSPSS